MAGKAKYIGVSLHDDWARAFLRLPQPTTENSWCAYGWFIDEAEVGVWVEVNSIMERRGPDGIVRQWPVTPKLSLIKAEAIITYQVYGEEQREMGFRPGRWDE